MADVSRNPEQQAQMERLAAALQQLDARFAAQIDEMNAAVARQETTAGDLEAAVRQELAARQQIGSGAGAAGAGALEPQVLKDSAAEATALAAAEERATAAAAERVALEERERALLGGLSGSGGGGIPPERPPAPPGGPEPWMGMGGAQPPAYGIQAQEIIRRRQIEAQDAAAAAAAQQTPPTPTPTPTPVNLQEVQTQKEAQLARNLELFNQIASAERGVGTGAEYEARMVSLSSQAYERHGALQTEWLAALAKGQVTVRDFGSQMLSTIGKFAGWTGAAAAVYGVIAAVTELGKGALEGASATDQLKRTITGLDTGRAAEQIRQLAEDTATSLSDAGNAVFLFSRTFHNQDDAVYAAGLALRAYKLDGVSLNDQVRAQTALMTQFGLSARDLGPVYGLLAQGQREFNARINEMIPALMNSASQIANAGGNLDDYIKILQLALRTTQATGSVLATAFRRSPGFIEKPKNEQMLQALGFNPQEALTNYTAFIDKAIHESARWSGAQRQQFLRAAFGQQQGPRIAGLFRAAQQDPKLVQDILGQSVKSQQPLAEEFAKFFDVPKTQIAELGTRLQTLGSRLESSGLLTGLGLVVRALDDSLRLANDLLKAFDSLPGPLKEAVGVLAAVRIGQFALGRFPQAAGTPSAASSSPALGVALGGAGRGGLSGFVSQNTQKQAVLKLLEEERGFYQDAWESANQRIFQLKSQEAAQINIVRSLEAEGATEKEINAAIAKVVGISEREKFAYEQEAVARGDLALVDKQRAEFIAGLARRATVQSAAAGAGIGFGGPLGRPTAGAEPVPIGAPGAAAGLAGAGVAGAAMQARSTAQAAQQAGAQATEQAAAQQEVSQAVQGAGQSYERLTLGMRATDAAMTVATVATSAAKAGMNALVGLLNPWTLLLFGLPTVIGSITSAFQHFHDTIAAANAALAKIPSGGQNALQTAAQALEKRSKADADRWREQFLFGVPLLGSLTNDLAKLIGTGGSPRSERERVTAGSLKDINDRFNLLIEDVKAAAAIDKGTSDSRAKFYALLATIKSNAPGVVSGLAGITPSLQNAAIQNLNARLQQQYQAFQQSLPVVQPGTSSNPFAQISQTSLTQNLANLQVLSEKARVYGVNTQQLTQMARLYTFIAGKESGSMDTATLQKVDEARTEMIDAIRTHIQGLIDAANAITVPSAKAAGEAAHAAALRQKASLMAQASAALDTSLKLLATSVQQFDAYLAATVANLNNAEQQLTQITQLFNATAKTAFTPLTGDKSGSFNVTPAQGEQLKKQILDGLKNRVTALKGDITAQKAAQQAYDQAQATLGPLNNQLSNAGQAATNSIASGAASTKSSAQSAAQKLFELARARREYAKALASGDPVAQAQQGIAEANLEIQAAANEKDKLQGLTDLATAHYDLTQALAQRTAAYFTLLQSTSQNPLQIDRYGIEAARKAIGFTKPGTADRFTAQATLNDALNKYRDDKVSEREQTIQFELSMNDITAQQAELDIEALMKMKNLSYDTRKRLRQELEQIRKGDQGTFGDLNLNSLTLPTPYEIRRAYQAAVGGINVTQHYATTIQVSDVRGAHAVGDQMDRYHRGTGKAIARAVNRR